MAPRQEKRSGPRVTTIVPVTCTVTRPGPHLPSQATRTPRGTTIVAKVVNIGRAGLLINSDRELDPGTRLEVVLRAPDDGHQILAETEVAWSRRNAINMFGKYAAGMVIQKIADDDLKILARFFQAG